MLVAMWLKHDRDLQMFVGMRGRLGHGRFLDPGDLGLRGTMLSGEAGLDAGLQSEYEGRSAGSLWYTPSLAHFW